MLSRTMNPRLSTALAALGSAARFICGYKLCLCAILIGGCRGPQSALDPAGLEAQRIAALFWWMTGGVAVIWLGMMALAVYCVRARPEAFNQGQARVIIVGGGTILPAVVLAVLLMFGLAMLPDLIAPAPPGSLTIEVDGELWWWRVRYPSAEGVPIVLANEIHLPVGEPVEFHLASDNVIHSFWIPALAGKVDMLPGRTTRLALTPVRTGLFHGACAEYCGTSHALMKFDVVVEEKENFQRWLASQAGPAKSPAGPVARRGQQVFQSNGCGACHSVRGTSATGVIGPDLTHVGSRLRIGAATLPSDPDHFQRWITLPEKVKPGALMPRFNMLPEVELQALGVYLKGLE